MAKAQKATAAVASPARANKRTVSVTYCPVNVTDPNVTKWNGVTFHANVPVELDPAVHFILVPRNRIVMIDGIARAEPFDEKVSMIEIAKGNPSFKVEGFPRAKHIIPTAKLPPAGAEWAGTNRDELIPAGEINYPDDFDPAAGALIISSDKAAA